MLRDSPVVGVVADELGQDLGGVGVEPDLVERLRQVRGGQAGRVEKRDREGQDREPGNPEAVGSGDPRGVVAAGAGIRPAMRGPRVLRGHSGQNPTPIRPRWRAVDGSSFALVPSSTRSISPTGGPVKSRAAVAYEAGQPLQIEEIEVGGPRAGEVLIEIRATGVCHTDAYTAVGEGSRGPLPGGAGARGGGGGGRGRRGRDQRRRRGPRDPPLHPRVPPVRLLPVRSHESLPGDPGHPGSGAHAGRVVAVLPGGHHPLPLHGDVDLLELHRPARDRGGEDPPRRPLRQGLLHRLRGHHRHRGGHQHGPGSSPGTTSSSSASGASGST